MKSETHWQGNFTFENRIRQHRFVYDVAAPHGADAGPSPKEALLSTIAGCTGMDIAGAIRKYTLPVRAFHVSAEAETTQTQPKIFTEVRIRYEVTCDADAVTIVAPALLKAVTESMTKYCGVSAMIAPTSPMVYVVALNGQITHEGRSAFPTEKR